MACPIRGCHPLWPVFPDRSGKFRWSPGPISLATTFGVSVDVLSSGYLDVSVPRVSSLSGDLTVGFPHSEIHGSKLIRSSPQLIAAYHVFHRLSAPRHPLNALKALDRSHYRCPQLPRRSCIGRSIIGLNDRHVFCKTRHFLIGQIKSTRIHELTFLSPGCGSNKERKLLFTMSKNPAGDPRGLPAKLMFFDLATSSSNWWSQTGSNRRPHACKARALPTELWPQFQSEVVGPGRLERPTSRLSGVRSNHLSYGPFSEHASETR